MLRASYRADRFGTNTLNNILDRSAHKNVGLLGRLETLERFGQLQTNFDDFTNIDSTFQHVPIPQQLRAKVRRLIHRYREGQKRGIYWQWDEDRAANAVSMIPGDFLREAAFTEAVTAKMPWS